MRVRVPATPGASEAEIARAVSRAILARLILHPMPETGLANSPNLVKGAIVQLIEDIIGVLPNVIPFQYNPTGRPRRSRRGTPSR